MAVDRPEPEIELDRHEYRDQSRRPWLPHERVPLWTLIIPVIGLVLSFVSAGFQFTPEMLGSSVSSALIAFWLVSKFRRRFFDIED